MHPTSILLLVLSSCLFLCSCSGAHVYYIEPTEGDRCPQNASSCLNINAFGNMADKFSNTSDMVVYFINGTHSFNLSELVVFRNLNNATFEGLGWMEQGFHETVWQSTVVIKCTDHLRSSGIAFANCSNITFKSITITNCGASAESLGTMYQYTKATLIFFGVTDLAVDMVSIQNGSRVGLFVVSHGSDLTISSSSFASNGPLEEHSPLSVYLFYTDPLESAQVSKLQTFYTHIINTNVSFGGLAISLMSKSYTMDIVLDHVVAYNSTGTNIALITGRGVSNYTLTISDTTSTHAYSELLASGLGLFIYSLQGPCRDPNPMPVSQCIIRNSKFTDNYNAGFGGGITVIKEDCEYRLILTIESTEISRNVAGTGSGLLVYHILHNIDTQNDQLKLFLSNVTIDSNHVNFEGLSQLNRYRAAAIITVSSSVKLNDVRITNNNSTGLLAYDTTVLVGNSSETVFHNNSGANGGGLALYKDSYLMFEEGARLTFTNNSATERGAAIFVEISSSLVISFCFFQWHDSSNSPHAMVYFSGNEASEAGSVLYGSNIDGCSLQLIGNIYYSSSYVFNSTFNYSDQTGPSVIASAPSQVCFCQNNTPDCSLMTLNVSAYPGEEITVPLVTVGQRKGVVPGTIHLHGENNTPAFNSQLYGTNPINCTNIYIEIPSTGTEFAVNSIVLTETQSDPSVQQQPVIKRLNITIQGCPLGFQLSNVSRSCDCLEIQQKVSTNITCNVTTQRFTRQEDLWMGFDNTSQCVVLVEDCPFDYCDTSEVSFTLTDPDPQCALNRTGTLCGSCQHGLSLSLGSNNCMQCTNSYIALILPFAAAGFGLVAFLMVLNLTVSAGTINGLIFYANIVKVNEHIFFPHGPIPVLSQFISWLNLDFGIETCFFNGMTAYAKVWLQFVFPLFIWVIIATIIVLCRYSTWLSNKIGGNVVPVLATLILLSYTKLFRTIVLTLKPAHLDCTFGNQTRLVWYVDGTIDYFSWQHVLLFLMALAFLLLSIPYTLILLFDTLIEKYLTEIRLFRRWWVKFKPLIDAYRGPYKDSCRFWTGLLLLARLGFASVSSFVTSNDVLVAINTAAVLLLFLITTLKGVYQKRHLDILECWCFFNLTLLSVATFANAKQGIGVKISVSLILVTFVGVLIYHTFLRLQEIEWLHTRVVKWFKKPFTKTIQITKKQDTKNTINNDKLVMPDAKVPTTSEVYLKRETMLDDPYAQDL